MKTARNELVRAVGVGAVLALALYAGARRVGPLPAFGPFLDPVRGVWALTAGVNRPTDGTARISGLQATARILYDDRAVPHIFASHPEDAARALGYVVARDRLFQLEMRWRAASGRLSELLGPNLLGYDRSIRRIGLARSAERDLERLDPASELARQIRAFADGVNAWIREIEAADLPLEYHLLGARPAPWDPIYSLYIIKLIGWDLTYRSEDLRRLRATGRVGARAAEALFPVNSPIQEPIQPNGHREPRFDFATLPPPGAPEPDAARIAASLERTLGPALAATSTDPGGPLSAGTRDRRPGSAGRDRVRLGSNNWAVSPERTAAGHALLAGDPHLELTLPSTWYEVHLTVPDQLDLYGVTSPGTPSVILGFNRDVAWSFTNTGADVIDYYEEELDDPEHPSRYRIDGDWHSIERRIEEYRGPDGARLAVDTLYFTHRGPLLEIDGRFLSMRWTVLEGIGAARALAHAPRAATVQAWLEVMEPFDAPAQNMVVADRQGSIAIRSTGHFPIHPDGNGRIIRDGSTRESDWRGFWPVDAYPFAIDPAQGYLASANQQPIDPDIDDTYLGANWPSPWRALRINELLRGDSTLTPDAMRRYQTDPGNPRAELFLPFFLNAAASAPVGTETGGTARRAARLLGDWDRRYTKENERALLFEYAMDELVERVWDELERVSEDGDRQRVATPSSDVLAGLLHDPESIWWDQRATPDRVEDRDAVLVESLAAAWNRALQRHGPPEAGGWRWDAVRHANIYHLLGLRSLSALELPIRGGPGTLNPSSGSGRHGASWRMVVELGPELRAWSIYPGGQSGHPLSANYRDRIDTWVQGELERVRFPRDPSELATEHTVARLTLEPGT